MWSLLFALACAPPEPTDIDAWGGEDPEEIWGPAVDAGVAPPPGPDLVLSEIVSGQVARGTLAPVPNGVDVHWVVSLGGPGNGPCYPALGGACLDVVPPLRRIGISTAQGGYATETMLVPPLLIGMYVAVQAVVPDPAGGPARMSPVRWRRAMDLTCPAVLSPVCAVDGTTWPNACEAELAGWPVAHAGPC